VPFAAIYLLDADGKSAQLIAGTRLPDDPTAFPAVHPIGHGDAEAGPWRLGRVARTQRAAQVVDLPQSVGRFTTGLWPDLVETAFVLPLAAAAQARPAGFLVAGISPRQVLDADYRSFLELAAGQIATTIAGASAFQAERRRAKALVEVDRAKTAFFSNVSHEFRTPLTMMLGPLEDALANTELPAHERARLDIVHRNSLRLLKLVNSLLDFSRIEAGRARATYHPVDLAAVTADLASAFRSACERADLALVVDCPPLDEPVHVDRDMWEKIVLNLLSNAFKFTFAGEIVVCLRAAGQHVELTVRDTGVGIPSHELPRLFERFHRIEGQKSRTYEGSGIGLALVQELVRLHGGTIRVDSEENRGTQFAVTVPFGTTHLQAGRIGGDVTSASTGVRTDAFVEEALRWRPQDGGLVDPGDGRSSPAPAAERPRILLADDNADMLDYVARLLSGRWEIEAVGDGQAALEAARRRKPDLVLADVMMPRLDGFALLSALRRDPKLADVPVVLLSARAGEEAQIEGLQAGADDYLVKPFSARELMARVEAHLKLSSLRGEAAERIAKSEARLAAAIDLVGLSPYSWHPATGVLEWDARLKAIWGLPADAHVDMDVVLGALHPDDRPRVEAGIADCVDPGGDGVFEIEYRVIGITDGVERWVSMFGRTTFDAGGPVGFIGAALDTTARKRAEQRLRESEERFRQFADHSTTVLWILNTETSMLEYVSPAFEQVWGEARERVIGGPARLLETFHPDDRLRATEVLERVRLGDSAIEEHRIVRADGGVRWIRNTLFPIRDAQGRMWRIGGIAQDITIDAGSLVYVVDADDVSRERVLLLLSGAGYRVKAFATGRTFLEVAPALLDGCIVLDISRPESGGLTILRELKARQIAMPVIVSGSSQGNIRRAVQAMKAGAIDWLEMPYEEHVLLAAVATAMSDVRDAGERDRAAQDARARINKMSARARGSRWSARRQDQQGDWERHRNQPTHGGGLSRSRHAAAGGANASGGGIGGCCGGPALAAMRNHRISCVSAG
jgi:PAS domain S-box-containing protein